MPKIFVKSINLNNLVKIFILFGCMYQTIDLTLSYCYFETIMKLSSTNLKQHFPSVTFCVQSENELKIMLMINKINVNVSNLVQMSILCKKKNLLFDKSSVCNNGSEYVESKTPFAFICVTYLSQLLENNRNFVNLFKTVLNIEIRNGLKPVLLIHDSRAPPHLGRYEIKLQRRKYHQIVFEVITEILLPKPYETDCFDYSINIGRNDLPKSREDCIVRYMQSLEYNRCKCNRKWFYRGFEDRKVTEMCKFKNCSVIDKEKIANKLCKKSCSTEYHINYLKNTYEMSGYLINKSIGLKIEEEEVVKVVYEHIPKMDLIYYLSSIGGLINMWFGKSIYFLAHSLASYVCKYLILYLMTWKTIITTQTSILKISVWMIKNHKKVLILICTYFMLNQIYFLLSDYLKYETITRFRIAENIYLPNLILSFPAANLEYNWKKLLNIYNESQEEYKMITSDAAQNGINQEIILKWHKFLKKYALKLLIDSKFDIFYDIIKPNQILNSCEITINSISISCSEPKLHFEFTSGIFLFSMSSLLENMSKTNRSLLLKHGIERNLNYISLNLKIIDDLFLTLESSTYNTKLLINKFYNTDIYYSSNTFFKISNSENNCKHYEDQQSVFMNSVLGNCANDCYLLNYNSVLHCLPLNKTFLAIDFNKYFSDSKFKVCSNESNLSQKMRSELKRICRLECLSDCKIISFFTKMLNRKSISNENNLIVRIIPKKSHNIEYMDTYQTELNQLIYNLGGIIGMWFGLSPADIVVMIRILLMFILSAFFNAITFVKNQLK